MYSPADLENLGLIDTVAANEGEFVGFRLFEVYDWATDNDWLRGE